MKQYLWLFNLNDNSIELISAIDLPSVLGDLEVDGEVVIDVGVSIQFKNILFNDIIISQFTIYHLRDKVKTLEFITFTWLRFPVV